MRIIPENNWNHRYKLLAKEHNIALPPKEDDQTTTERRRPETDPVPIISLLACEFSIH
ncbi:hypothetical protein HID58_070858 [Brassica napus]|uniref:Uncharacterized protein n=1 Tax=Brassica napus TaxID=3708 RepID=A0ABQ7YZW5_BRANA|nr:hypothetical protein HID58_070858 [Brassica napus]